MQRPRDQEYAGSSLFREERDAEFRDDEIGAVAPLVSGAAPRPPSSGAQSQTAAMTDDRVGSPPRHRSSVSSGGSWRIDGLGSSHSSLSSLGGPGDSQQQQQLQSGFRPRRREMLAWVVVAAQAMVIAAFSLGFGAGGRGGNSPPLPSAMEEALRMNNRPLEYYERQRQRSTQQLMSPASSVGLSSDASSSSSSSSPYGSPAQAQAQAQVQQQGQSPREPFYESPVVHPKDAGLVERTWHSNGSPSINGDLKKGSCWCSADEWCMCTPSVAVDVILRSGPDHVWMVRRADTGKLALMGGMIEVGETAEQAVHRELREEMNVVLPPDCPPSLFGVYSDPLRDARRHTASIVYVVDVPLNVAPKAGDDATEVMRVSLNDIDHRTFFVDHKTMLRDYRAAVANGAAIGGIGAVAGGPAQGVVAGGDAQAAVPSAPLPLGPGGAAGSEAAPFAPGEPVRRSVCPIPVAKVG